MLHKHTQYYKIKKLTLFLMTIKTEYCTFLSADKWLVLALACFQTMAALHKNNHFIFTMSWVIFGKIIWLWKQYDFFRHFFSIFLILKTVDIMSKLDQKKVKFFILMKLHNIFFIFYGKIIENDNYMLKRKSRWRGLSFTYQYKRAKGLDGHLSSI